MVACVCRGFALDNADDPFQLYLAKTLRTAGRVIEPAAHHHFPWGLFHLFNPATPQYFLHHSGACEERVSKEMMETIVRSDIKRGP